MRKLILPIALIVVIGGLIGIYAITNSKNSPASNSSGVVDPNHLAGIQTGDAPWQPEITHLRERLTQIGLPALSAEGTSLHIHEHLDLYIHGQKITVPAEVGINQSDGFIATIHTHDTTGVIHVESPMVEKFYLGQFFDTWGVLLTQACLGGYCNSGANQLKVYSNGQLVSDPANLELSAHQEIVITYGTSQEEPAIPKSFDFPKGL